MIINFNYKSVKINILNQQTFLFFYYQITQSMKSARTILSPVKENQLPQSKQSPLKDQKTKLNQILTYLKQNGIKLPTYLLGTKNPQEFSLKLNPVQSSSKGVSQVKSLRIKLTDTQFELKKLQEDFAQYKRTVKIQKQKQSKKFEQALQRLKSDSKQNNQDYDFAKQNQVKKHSQQLQKLRTQYTHKLQKLQKQLTLKHSNQINKLKNKSASQLESLQIEHNKKYNIIHRQLNEQIQTLKKQFQKQKHNINLRNKQKLQQTIKKYQSTCTALLSQKKTEQKLHQKTKVDAQKQKQKVFGQLCYQRNVKKNLQDQIKQKNKQIKELKSKIHELNVHLEIEKENAINEKQWAKDDHQKQVQRIHSEYENKIKNILQDQKEACLKYDTKIQRLNYLHTESENLAEQKLQALSMKFDQRLSKQQDLDQIRNLTQTVVKRDQQIKKLTRQLRYRNLQIQNKEEVYNKIFKSSTRMREQKKLASINKCEYPIAKLERDSWSKQSLFRKSQTADVKFILKSMNKTKRQNSNGAKQQ